MVRRTSGKVNYSSMYNSDEDDESEDQVVQPRITKKVNKAKKKKSGPRGKISPSKTPASKKKLASSSSRSGGRQRSHVSYASSSEDDQEEQSDFDDEVSSEYDDDSDDSDFYSRKRKKSSQGKRGSKSAKKLKKARPGPAREKYPPVSEMVIESIKALKDNPRKGSTLGSIKETIALNWPVNMVLYDKKIKKFILKAVDNNEIIRTRGTGLRGRFTVPGMKAKRHKKKTKLTKKFDEDEEEYKPVKTARDEDREKDQEELEKKREERRTMQEIEAQKKASKPKKVRPKQDVWEVETIKGMRQREGKTFYLVKFKSWKKPQWEPEENVQGCDDAIEEFIKLDNQRKKNEEAKWKKAEEEGQYEVQRIIEVKFLRNNTREFLIRWVGCRPDEDTWEPEANLDCPELIQKFMANWEKVKSVEGKSLRENRKPVERLAFASHGSRASKRGGFRVTYAGMDD